MSAVGKDHQVALERVRLRFEAFRSANKPRTRIPAELRQAVVAALRCGVSMSALQRTCGLSAAQIADWQQHPVAAVSQAPSQAARVFELTDKAGLDDTLELRVGNWAITIRSAAACSSCCQ